MKVVRINVDTAKEIKGKDLYLGKEVLIPIVEAMSTSELVDGVGGVKICVVEEVDEEFQGLAGTDVYTTRSNKGNSNVVELVEISTLDELINAEEGGVRYISTVPVIVKHPMNYGVLGIPKPKSYKGVSEGLVYGYDTIPWTDEIRVVDKKHASTRAVAKAPKKQVFQTNLVEF